MQSLESDVIDALRAGKKVQAIKNLREHRKIGLKEAKDIVDHYVATHADQFPALNQANTSKVGFIIIALIFAIAAFIFLTPTL